MNAKRSTARTALLASLALGAVSCASMNEKATPVFSPLEAFALTAPFENEFAREPMPFPGDVEELLSTMRNADDASHLGLLVEYGLRVHRHCLMNTGLSRKLPVASNLMLAELVRLTDMRKYTSPHEAGWLNNQIYMNPNRPMPIEHGWSSYQVYIWAKEHFSTIISSGEQFANAERIIQLLTEIDGSTRNGLGGAGVCHYGGH